MTETIKQKLKKIKELAERGMAGERETAKRMLFQMMRKYNVTLDELKSDEIIEFFFKYSTTWEKKLITQVFAMVQDDSCVHYSIWPRKKTIYLKMTKLQAAEMDMLLKIYKKAFKKEIKNQMDIVYKAFLHKHNIYPATTSPDENDSNKEEINLDDLFAILSMSRNMDDVIIPRAQIAAGSAR